MSIPIFVDEDIIKQYITDKLQGRFSDYTIEEIIDITETAKYKDFATSFKIDHLRKQIHFRLDNQINEDLNGFISNTDFAKLKWK